MIQLTDRAVVHVKSLLTQHGLDGYGLRVGISAGGCSGYSYVLDLVEGADEGDEVFEFEGIQVFCDPKSFSMLKDLQVDYESSLMGGGFKFHNPNAAKACGCGTSFSC